MSMPRLSLSFVAVVLAAGACGTSTTVGSSAEPETSVGGTLRMSGGPLGASQPGVPGQVNFDGNGHRTVAVAAADGTFSISLTPGIYEASGTSPQFDSGQGRCFADKPIVVAASEVTGLVVACSRR